MKPVTLKFRICQIGLAIAGVFGVAFYAQTADTDIASEPLAQAASGVKPNIMFILDDSGSMAWDYLPDYVPDNQPSGASTTAACFDAGDGTYTGGSNADNTYNDDDSTGLITGRPDACVAGDPPYMSSNFNKVYYNPAIYYRPAANADGTDKNVMNAGNTVNWTAVPTDAFGIQNSDQRGQSVTTTNLVIGYPDRVWCLANGDSATGANCLINSGYTYPDNINKYGRDGSGNVKYRFGSPYHYTTQTAQYCTDATLSTCKSGSAINPNIHIVPAGEFCTDSELTNCAVGTAVTAAHIFSGVRWCSDAGTLLTCQRKKIGNFKFAKHLGTTTIANIAVPAKRATGTITVTTSVASSQITAITINGIAIIAGAITASSSSTSTTASQIAAAIQSYTSTPDYTALASGSTVTITAPLPGGTGENGKAVAVTAPSTGTVRASATLTINSSSNNSSRNITQVTANAINITSATCSGSFGNGVTASGGTITAGTGTNSTSERASVASAVASCINAATATNGGYSAISSANVVTVRASLSAGANANGRALAESGTISTNGSNFGGGQSTGIFTATANMSGGAAASIVNQTVRIGVGIFSRTDIVSSTTDYPKGPQRIDCSGATCTYQEEMTNFANWYAYYRTRMQMMKSAAGRAFIPIDDTYRVGFITINPGSPVSSNKYLKIDTYDTTHKSAWYTKFYGRNASGGTPLREALSRVGRLYAGRFDGIDNGIPSTDDPMQYSCQPNFAILSTDGYWNGNAGKKIDSSDMTQQDNVDIGPYSKRTDGVYDGGSSTTVGLADVALYYYQTDLRTGSTDPMAPNNVPTTQRDFAAHQHMTTFTLGLGLDGQMSYRSDYETASAGDFKSITQGSLTWPNPVGDTPAALDDLWHAAVNGRGAFFSASNPQELANSLSETLDALQKRVGAGAAAATSNLQPVAGDNFAFTAQYQTSDWIGDLKARTIDLSTGIVSAVPLWSAQALLDAKVYSTRNIYMPDLTDVTATGNKLKHFCWPGTSGTTCSDGSGLDAAEQAYFNPNQLPQSVSWDSAQKAVAAVDVVTSDTGRILVNWLRGETAYENTGAVAPTDLFRNRVSILGDIINAQPAYVKASPFNYTDTGYLEFKACTEGTGTGCPSTQFPTPGQPRRGTVFAAANDGMLHAFETDVNNNPYFQTGGIGTAITSDDSYQGNNTGNGEERWAFIPGMVLPNIYKLASTPYSHRYFTDGSPAVGDICISNPCNGLSDWRTMLVAGLNSGGRGYYALDITNPLAPKLLWEFKVRKPSETTCAVTIADAIGATDDCDLGLTYGNPILSKFNGQWVVFVTSGYNNTGEEPGGTARQGDGKGYLYILNAVTGAIIKKIGTGVGDGGTAGASYTDADPSGLARINNWVDNALINNTATAVYGGDLKGNLWRFDLDSTSSSYLTAVKVATLTTGVTPQPITTKPELGLINTFHVVFVATGKFLGVSDKTDTTAQTIYAIKDDLNTNVPVISRTPLVQQSLISGTTTRTATANPVDWTNPAIRGWYVDLPDSGERVSVDPQLQLGSLIVASNVPSTDTCTAGGYAWINTFDYKTGSYITSDSGNITSTKLSSSVVVGINVIQLPGGAVKAIVTTADNQQLSQDTPVAATTFQGKRVSWREITTDQ